VPINAAMAGQVRRQRHVPAAQAQYAHVKRQVGTQSRGRTLPTQSVPLPATALRLAPDQVPARLAPGQVPATSDLATRTQRAGTGASRPEVGLGATTWPTFARRR
jgi:hypothetical protein